MRGGAFADAAPAQTAARSRSIRNTVAYALGLTALGAVAGVLPTPAPPGAGPWAGIARLEMPSGIGRTARLKIPSGIGRTAAVEAAD